MLFPLLRAAWLSLAVGLISVRADDPVRIGEYLSLTGKETSFGRATHQGNVLAIETINASGGVLGRPLELFSEDTASRPGTSAEAARRLIERDHVVAVLGEIASSRSLEAAPVCQQAGIPMLTPTSTNAKVTEVGDYIFRACFIDPFQGRVMAKFAQNTLKAKKVAVLYSATSAYSTDLARFFKEAFTTSGGTIVSDQRYAEGDKDFSTALNAIKTANPDALFSPGYYTEGAALVKQARQLGFNAPIFAGDSWESNTLIQLGGREVEGVYLCSHYSPQDPAPRVQAFVAALKKRWGAEASPISDAALGYDSVMILADAIKRAGSPEPRAIRDALAETKQFEAVTGTITLDQKRDAAKSAVIITVKNGAFQFVQRIAP